MNLRDLFGVETKLKVSIFKNNSQINSTATTIEYEFCQQNEPEPGQVKDWYLNVKMAVVPVCFIDACCLHGA